MKPKLLFFSDCIFYGGSEKVLTNLLSYRPLFERFEVRFAFRDHRAYRAGVEAQDLNCPVDPLPLKSFDNAHQKLKGWRSPWRQMGLLPMVLAERAGLLERANAPLLAQYFKAQAPDVLFINNGGYPGAAGALSAALAAKAAGVPQVAMMINNMATAPSAADQARDQALRSAVDAWVTASKAAGAQLIENRGIDPEKWLDLPNTLREETEVAQIPPGRLREEFGLGPEVPVILAAGLLTDRKGHRFLIEALGQIKEQLGGAQCFIFGEGERRGALEGQIRSLGLQGQIHLPGHRSNLLEYLKDADLFVMPSTGFEDFPYANIEAMLLAKPIIGSAVAGIPEQIKHGQTGLVVPPCDAKALAGALHELLAEPTKREAMGQAAQARYQALFAYQPVMERFLALFEQMAQRPSDS